MISEGNTDLYVIPYQNAGYAGGYGYKYTIKGIIGGMICMKIKLSGVPYVIRDGLKL